MNAPLTTVIDIDRDAPVISHEEMIIKAPLDVRTTESWSGEPVRVNVTALQAALDASLHVWLGHLRDEAAQQGPAAPRSTP